MIIYTVTKNDVVIEGRLFAFPEHAVKFFIENFTAEYPDAKFEGIENVMIFDLSRYGYFSVKSDSDLWEVRKYISEERNENDEI